MAIFDLDEKIDEMSIKEVLNFLTDEQKKELIGLLTKEKKEKEKDDIFLLSVEEYEELKDSIPLWRDWWWLRSPSDYYGGFVACVYRDGSINYRGFDILDDENCVRPVIRYKNFNFSRVKYDTIVALGYTWKIISEELAIAESPIFIDKFDAKSNDYEKSEIRSKLIDWADKRRHW